MLPAEIAEGLKLLGEKLDEAVVDRNSQTGAIVEAAGAIPLIRDYIKANDKRIVISMLVCEQITFDDSWWDQLAKYEREKFLQTAYSIRKGLCGLEAWLTGPDNPS